jgi:tellurite resistance protein
VFSSKNRALSALPSMAETIRADRQKADPANPLVKAEGLWIEAMTQAIDLWRDQRDMMVEMAFLTMWGTPWARAFGRRHELRRTLKDQTELRALPQVQAALAAMETGGFAEAVIRMLVLMAENRKGVRRDRLERSNRVLTEDEPFASLGPDGRARIISEQTLISTYEPDRAIETLPALLTTPEDRDLAIRVAYYVPGDLDEMAEGTLALLHRFCDVLGVPRRNEPVTVDPLTHAPAVNGADPNDFATTPAPRGRSGKTGSREQAQ